MLEDTNLLLIKKVALVSLLFVLIATTLLCGQLQMMDHSNIGCNMLASMITLLPSQESFLFSITIFLLMFLSGAKYWEGVTIRFRPLLLLKKRILGELFLSINELQYALSAGIIHPRIYNL